MLSTAPRCYAVCMCKGWVCLSVFSNKYFELWKQGGPFWLVFVYIRRKTCADLKLLLTSFMPTTSIRSKYTEETFPDTLDYLSLVESRYFHLLRSQFDHWHQTSTALSQCVWIEKILARSCFKLKSVCSLKSQLILNRLKPSLIWACTSWPSRNESRVTSR